MKIRKINFYFWLVKKLPKRILYFCFVQVVSETTTGIYSKTVVPDLKAMDALKRFEEKHRL